MVFLSLLCAHLIANFYLQKTNKKNDNNMFSLNILWYFFLVFISLFSIILYRKTLNNIYNYVIYPTLALTFFHFLMQNIKNWIMFLVDLLKRKYKWSLNKITKKINIWTLGGFFLYQFLHLIIILIICRYFFSLNIKEFTDRIFMNLQHNKTLLHTPIEIVLFLIIIFILSTTVSGRIVTLLIGSLPKYLPLFEGKYSLNRIIDGERLGKVNREELKIAEDYTYVMIKHHDLSRGKIIGYIERLIVIILIFNNQYTAIAFIITAKSLARFKQMDDREWAEYFLLGTLTSILLGIAWGTLIKLIIQ